MATEAFTNRKRCRLSGTTEAVSTADFSGDGKFDISLFSNLANGDGTFTQTPQNLGGHPSITYTTDLNRDGNADLIVLLGVRGTVDVFLGKGDGTFQPAMSFGAPIQSNSLVIDDLDNDGYLDLAITTNRSNSLAILLGNGTEHSSRVSTSERGSTRLRLSPALPW